MESRLGSERPDVASLDPDPQSHLVLSRAATRHRSAITLEDLTRLVAVCNTDPSLVPLRVALVFGFLGYLRISNMTPPTAQSFDPTRHTSWADVRPCEQGLLLDLKWTKTLQTQHGVTTIPLSSLLDQRICPVAAWTYTGTCFQASTLAEPPRSCSPQLLPSVRPFQPRPSGPCSIGPL